ncbi:hypothetical protein [Streptomyces zagrosensis]|uniref:Uncharacterized protein n=1 Tax=Streptomyces zagrosensis TaxID=1042984 RepID=A0A7W9QHJ1_9ACTN|nr:hypothetical protein [Streptomyces zagrosensis]MBB5940084.1 hypothetical protein [Streptomyces zagrosensis]
MTTDLATQHAARATLWIDVLRRQFPELLEELVPGRPSTATRPSAPRSPAARQARADRDRADRADILWNEQHGLSPIGGGAAPINLRVSDAIRDITDGVVELEEAVRDKLRLGRPPRAAVPDRLRRLTRLLDQVAQHPALAQHVLDESRRMARRCGAALGDAEALVRVTGRCPWCDSVSLRAFPAWRAVLCVNPGCRCTEQDCPCATNPGHRHSWAETAWARLAAVSGADAASIAALVNDAEAGDA